MDIGLFAILRGQADVILAGATTVRVEGYAGERPSAARQEWRKARGLSEAAPIAVVTSTCNFDPGSGLFTGHFGNPNRHPPPSSPRPTSSSRAADTSRDCRTPGRSTRCSWRTSSGSDRVRARAGLSTLGYRTPIEALTEYRTAAPRCRLITPENLSTILDNTAQVRRGESVIDGHGTGRSPEPRLSSRVGIVMRFGLPAPSCMRDNAISAAHRPSASAS